VINKRNLGSIKEQMAMEYLQTQGVCITECNFRNRKGEIDLIGTDGEYLVFFEVKYRKDDSAGHPEEAVGFLKQKQICKVADFYRMQKKIGMDVAVRYDVIAIEGHNIQWIQNAFPHIY